MPPGAFARRQSYGSSFAAGCGMDGDRSGSPEFIVFCVWSSDACEGVSPPPCLHLGGADLLCVEGNALSTGSVPEPSSDVPPRTGIDPGHAALVDRLGRFLLAGSSAFCAALVGGTTACGVGRQLRDRVVGGRDRGLSSALSMHAGSASTGLRIVATRIRRNTRSRAFD